MVFRKVPHLQSTVWHPPTRRTRLLSADSYHDRSSAHLAQDAGNDVSQAFRLGMRSVTIQLLARTPAHFPEVGLEPGGFLEDHDQLCLAGRRGVEIGETLQVRPRFRRDLLVWCTGILGDPNAIWVGCGVRTRSRGDRPAQIPE